MEHELLLLALLLLVAIVLIVITSITVEESPIMNGNSGTGSSATQALCQRTRRWTL